MPTPITQAFSAISVIKPLCICLAVLLLSNASSALSQVIQLASPYQSKLQNEHQISSKSKNVLSCVFDKMQLSFEVTQTPSRRAEKQLSSQKVDGIVTTIPFHEIEDKTILSAPLTLEKWSWYFKEADSLSPNLDLHLLNVGAINNSNQATWLKAQGYKQLTLVDSYEQLIKLIDKQRISAFIADQVPFQNALQNMKHIKVKSKFLNYIPKGVYFSKTYLEERPNFMARFNHNVHSCTLEVIELFAKEKLLIKKRVLPMIDKWVQAPLIKQTLETQNQRNAQVSHTQILAFDRTWIKELENSNYSLIQTVLDSSLSSFLSNKQQESDGLYTELFITDVYGLNAAMSQPTSDYWQGDELKYQKTLGTLNGSIYIDDIHYDDSTKKFQSQISIVITDSETNSMLGMLTVGIDVEKALSLE
jgi:ABC-type amino acid transport substrate-binding protein